LWKALLLLEKYSASDKDKADQARNVICALFEDYEQKRK
jgi:hypothetical protein